ncbi:MAG TPA: CocE/NonD family hydrolase [Streptosporangiaceae bacterium]|nr:CocE/NonD family hydrolase [Streptosporangiaceae bacterium]
MRFIRKSFVPVLSVAAAVALAVPATAAASAVKPSTHSASSALPELESVYVPMPDGVRLAADIWLPSGTKAGARLPAVLETDRYWRAAATAGGVTNNPDYYIASPWTARGYAYVFADIRGTGASFGTLTAELGSQIIADVGSLSDWIAARPWSDGRVGVTGVSYAADTAVLSLVLRDHHITAAAPVSYDFDPYEDLLRPGGILIQPQVAPYSVLLRILDGTGGTTCATSAQTQQICAALNLTGASPEPVGGPDGARLLAEARAQHYGNVNLIDMAAAGTYRDYVNGPESWTVASAGSKIAAIRAGGVPILTYAGWLDAGTANGVLSQFASLSGTQDDWIGPWSHGQGYFADPFQPSRLLTAAEHTQLQDVMFTFFDRYVKDSQRPAGTRVLHYYTLNQGRWHTTTSFPVPGTRMQTLYFGPGQVLASSRPAAPSSNALTLDPAAGTGQMSRWHTNLTGAAVSYPDRGAADRLLLSYTSAALPAPTTVTGLGRITLNVTGLRGTADGALYAYLEDVQPDGRVVYVTEGQLALQDRALTAPGENPAWRMFRTPRSYDQAAASPFPAGVPQQITFDMLPTSVLFRPGDKIRITIAAADPDNFQLLPADGNASYRISSTVTHPSSVELPVVG